MFRTLLRVLADRVGKMDFLVALGTHPPMSEEQILRRVGSSCTEKEAGFPQVRFFNHDWQNPETLVRIGSISAEEVEEISGGRMNQSVDVTINRLVLEYDLLVILGPTFPHEVVGFSGGNKYLFPGIAGADIIDMFHWLGALITSPAIIGNKRTPVREIVDRAASMIPIERFCLSLVVKENGLVGLYAGPPEEAWSAAVDLSEKVHIVLKEKPFAQVLACAPPMYDDLWTGAKCMYKLEPIVADGGELIIYAPHIQQVSITHGDAIEAIGYHVRDYFLKQMDKFGHVRGGVMAHSTHVKGVGRYIDGVERPRINVVLATQISAATCAKINLGYCDPRTIHLQEWQDREHEGRFYVPKAGEMLYRLCDDPFKQAI
jgi:nickel-dependent lactate racemase